MRDITNQSKGTFGSKLARAALEAGHKVHYVCADDARTPFTADFDFYRNRDWNTQLTRFCAIYNLAEKHRPMYDECRFRNYIDYAALLKSMILDVQPKIIILAAAVSDYLVRPSKDKIRSGGDLTLQLEPAPKVISQIREWSPDCILCGFKLLVNASDPELIDAAWESVGKNRCDMVVANDLKTLSRSNHRIITVEPTWAGDRPGEPPVTNTVTGDLATAVISRLAEIAEGDRCTRSHNASSRSNGSTRSFSSP